MSPNWSNKMDELELMAHVATLEKTIKVIKSTIEELKIYPGTPIDKWHPGFILIPEDIQDLHQAALELESYIRVEKKRHLSRYPGTTCQNLKKTKLRQVAESTPDLFHVEA